MTPINHLLSTLCISVSDPIIKAGEPKPSSIEQIGPVQNIKVAQDVILSSLSKLSLTIQPISSDPLFKTFAYLNDEERALIKLVCKKWKSIAQRAYFESDHFKMTHLVSHLKRGIEKLRPFLEDCGGKSYRDTLNCAQAELFINSKGELAKLWYPGLGKDILFTKQPKQELYVFGIFFNPYNWKGPQAGDAFYLGIRAKKEGAFYQNPETPAILKKNFADIFLKEINQLARQSWEEAKKASVKPENWWKMQPWFILLSGNEK